ncbi:hypothetical protein ABID99_004749 [Mucilaginibacter sp. OAE612]
MQNQNQLFSSQHFAILKNALRWTVIIIPIAVVIGSAVCFILVVVELGYPF